MEKEKRKEILLAGGVLLFLLLAISAVVTVVSVRGKRREIDQKVLFIYRYQNGGHGNGYYVNKGYFIDGKGKQVEYDYTKSLDIGEGTWDDNELLEVLEEMEYEESEVIFSEREVEKLYDWLYKIDAEDVIETEYAVSYMDPGSYKLLGIRYKDDGTAEIIRIFDVGAHYVVSQEVSQDPYALKVREILLEKNPIAYWLEIIINGGMIFL